ncbi:MAG: GAF domain-containing protein [Planctomycetota bacterium]|jgi:hypothetical protein
MSDEKKKKKRRDEELEEKQEEIRQESELSEPDGAGTRTDDSEAHQTFFTFSGQLRDYEVLGLPESTQTDVGGADLGATPAEPPAKEADADDTDTDAPGRVAQDESSEAGPVRDDDPAASPSASQSREAAGPAHSIEDTAPGPADAEETRPEIPSAGEEGAPPTHTDVAGADDWHRVTEPTGTDPLRPPTPEETPADTTQTDLEPQAPVESTPEDAAQPPPPHAPEPVDPFDATQTDVWPAARAPEPADTATPADAPEADLPRTPDPAPPPDDALPADATETDVWRTPDRAPPEPADDAPPADATETDVWRAPDQPADAALPADATETDLRRAPHPAHPPPDEADETASVGDEPATTEDHARGGAKPPRGRATLGPDEETWTQDQAPGVAEPAAPAPAPQPAVPAPEADTASVDLPDPSRTRTDLGSLDEPLPVPPDPTFSEPPLFDVPAPPVSAEQAEAAEAEKEEPPRRARRTRVRRPRPSLKRFLKDLLDAYHPADLARKASTAVQRRLGRWTEHAKTAHAKRRLHHTGEWWRRTLTEIGVLYAIVVPVELAVSKGQIGSFGVHPHPYWLIVLPMAAARGVVAGMLTATIASILCAVGAWRAIGEGDLFTYGNMMEPILFYVVAFFTGELRDEMELKRRKLERRLEDVQERTTRLRQERDVLTDANRELEKRIVDDSVQFGNLIAAARRIERSGKQEIFELALEMVEEHCGAAASVLLLLEDGSLDYLAHRGWPTDELAQRLDVARASQFVARAVAEGVAINGFRPGEAPPAGGPLVVAPLFDAGGVVRALLCLDHVPVSRLNEATVTLFLGIADWVSAALTRLAEGPAAPAPAARRLEGAMLGDVFLGTPEQLGKRLRLELARCSRYGVPTSFLTVQATQWRDATSEGIEAVDGFVLTHFTSGLRPSDSLYRFGYPGCYLLVLAGTTVQGAEVVRKRLLRRVEYTPGNRVGTIEITATGPDAEAPDLISLAERVAARFRRFSPLALEGRCPIEVPDRLEVGDVTTFLHRLKMETSLAVRNGFDLHVAGITADRQDESNVGLLARHVLEAGAQTLRPTDGVYTIGPYQCAIVLPCTSGEEAATVVHRIATLVRTRDPNAPYGPLETQVLGLGPVHPDATSFLAALARRAPSGGSS